MTEKKPKPILRRGLFWAGIPLGVLLVAGIFVCIEIITHHHNQTIDLTPGKKYTLSEKTFDILASLDADVTIVTFFKMGKRQENALILELLAAASPKIQYRLIDLDRNPGKARVYGAFHSGDTFVAYKGESKSISIPKEHTLVNAILQMTQDRKKTLLIAEGHGEKPLSTELKFALEKENWRMETLFLPDIKEIPSEEKSVLLIPDPQSDFFPQEIDLLGQYLHKGGRIMLLLEPFVESPNLSAFLREYRILLKDDIIIDKENKLMGGDYLAPIIPYLGRTTFLEKIRSPLLLSSARSVNIADAFDLKITALVLASTAEYAWAKTGKTETKAEIKKPEVTFREGVDRPGPVPVAAWINLPRKEAQNHGAKGEMIVVGDSDFIDHLFLEAMGNKDFFMNTLEYLAQDTTLLSTRGKNVEYPYHHMDKAQGRFVFWFSVVIPSMIFLIIGVIVVALRRDGG